MIVTLEEAKKSLEDLIARSERGEEVTIVGEGQKPIARIGGYIFGLGKGQVWMSDDFDEPLEEFKQCL